MPSWLAAVPAMKLLAGDYTAQPGELPWRNSQYEYGRVSRCYAGQPANRIVVDLGKPGSRRGAWQKPHRSWTT